MVEAVFSPVCIESTIEVGDGIEKTLASRNDALNRLSCSDPAALLLAPPADDTSDFTSRKVIIFRVL
jgi:hypothetical protein